MPPDKTDSHFIRARGRELYEVFDSLHRIQSYDRILFFKNYLSKNNK